MPSFNLAYEPWIPCLLRGESLPQDLSLLDTLTRAHEIRELSDDSPLVTIALHRLLLAILHRNFGPPGFSEWKRLWQRGQWDGEKLAGYFAEWSEKKRFDLFDAERPFFQVPRLQKAGDSKKGKNTEASNAPTDAEVHRATYLVHESVSAYNGTLFDHGFTSDSGKLTAARAACYLVARQAFSLGGGVSYPFNLSHSPLIGGYTVLALGNNLFETLALNLLSYNAETPIPQRGADFPSWEQDQKAQPDKNGTLPLGYLDYLTWQSRRIHLITEGDSPVVSNCQLIQNLKLKDERGDFDPFRCYEQDSKGAVKARRINPARALWRDSHSLFQQTGKEFKRPEVFDHLANVETARRRGEITAASAYAFAVYGMANDQASVSLWTRERLPLPLGYLNEKALTAALEDALKLTEEVASNLGSAVKTLAKELVGDHEAGNLAASFGAREFYWSRLEPAFKKFLVDLAADSSGDETEYGEKTLPEWARTVTRIADAAFNQAVNSLSGSARELQAGAVAQTAFDKLMGKTCKTFARLFPQASTNQSTNGGQS
jgi:CRISPR system Cascade subunit CasA